MVGARPPVPSPVEFIVRRQAHAYLEPRKGSAITQIFPVGTHVFATGPAFDDADGARWMPVETYQSGLPGRKGKAFLLVRETPAIPMPDPPGYPGAPFPPPPPPVYGRTRDRDATYPVGPIPVTPLPGTFSAVGVDEPLNIVRRFGRRAAPPPGTNALRILRNQGLQVRPLPYARVTVLSNRGEANIYPTKEAAISVGFGGRAVPLGSAPNGAYVRVLDGSDPDFWRVDYNGVQGWMRAQSVGRRTRLLTLA